MIKKFRDNARDKCRNLFDEEKSKKKNVEEIDVIICLKKKKQNKQTKYQKKIREANKSSESDFC